MSCPNFTAEDFAKWNTTASCFRIPKKLVGSETIKQVRVALIEAIGAQRLCAVQALPDNKYRVEFSSPSIKIAYDINGLFFRGVTITPTPAYEQITNVFVDRAPLHMPNDYISSSLSAYGRVVNVQNLSVRGYNNIRTGTRMVTMSVLKPIPPELPIANFVCSVRYRGQPRYCFRCRTFGHFRNACPQSRPAKTRKDTSNDQAARNQPMDTSITRTIVQDTTVAPVEEGTSTSHAPPQDRETVMEVAHSGSDEAPVEDSSVAPVQVDSLVEPQVDAPVEPLADDQASETAVPLFTENTSSDKLVVEISEFKEVLTYNDQFSCHRRVSMVRKCASVKASKRHLRTARLAVRRGYKSSSASSSSSSSSSASSRLTVLRKSAAKRAAPPTPRSPIVPPSSVEPSPAIDVANRFAMLQDEADDMDLLAGTVVDPMVTSPHRSPPTQHTPSCLTPSAQFSDSDETEVSQQDLAVFSPPVPIRKLPDLSKALVPHGHNLEDSECSLGQRLLQLARPLPVSDVVPSQRKASNPSSASSIPALPACDSDTPESPESIPAGCTREQSDAPLTTPSCHFGTDKSVFSSGGSSSLDKALEPIFVDGGSDRADVSGGGAMPEPPASSLLSLPAAPQADVVTGQTGTMLVRRSRRHKNVQPS